MLEKERKQDNNVTLNKLLEGLVSRSVTDVTANVACNHLLIMSLHFLMYLVP